MIIKKRRIRTLGNNLPTVKAGQRVIVGVRDLAGKETLLKKVGFSNLDAGATVLPSPTFGPVSDFNANGSYSIHKDKSKETVYRMAEWQWKQWHGRDTIDMSKFVDVPYERYPRTFVPPPGVELKIARSAEGEKLLTTPVYRLGATDDQLLHAINLLLEIFGECHVLTEELNDILGTKAIRLNWRILPEGKRPWKELKNELSPLISGAPEGKRVLIEDRLKTINSFEPDFAAVGTAGFSGYIILGFPTSSTYVLESLYYGNATYVLGKNWETISKMTKAEILSENLHRERIIHRVGWHNRVKNVLKVPKVK